MAKLTSSRCRGFHSLALLGVGALRAIVGNLRSEHRHILGGTSLTVAE